HLAAGPFRSVHALLHREERHRNRPGAGHHARDRPPARRAAPRGEQARPGSHLHRLASGSTVMGNAPQERVRVLIVEDDAIQAEALSRVVAAEGREIIVASDGESGLAIAQSGVGLIVADYKLPGLNGNELVRRLRDEKVSAPVLIVSGEATVAIAVEAMKSGALDFVQKPFDITFF